MAARLTRWDRELIALGGRAIVNPGSLVDLVGPESVTALTAVDHRIGEVIDMAAGFPHGWMHDDGGIETDHVGTALDEFPPPHSLDLVLQLDTERAVVPTGARAAVDLAGLKNEATPLAERNERIHAHRHIASTFLGHRPTA